MDPRIDKLDDAFLFGLASIGIIISFLQLNLDKNNWVQIIGVMPFLLLGIGLPFIIGYLRGAISLNSVEERLRGWIYFLIGTSAYLAFFINNTLRNIDYLYRQGIFFFVIGIGLILTYGFLKWSKKVFGIHSMLSTYAFSATAFGAFIFSFLSSLIVGLLYDLQGKNILEMIYSFPIELVFWITIILFSSLLLGVFEKAAKYAIQHTIEQPNLHIIIRSYPKWARRILNIFFLKALLLGFALFEYAFDYNLKARILWIQSFIFWFLGCTLWAYKAPVLGFVFLIATIISFSVAAFFFYKTQITSFKGLDKAIPIKIGYGLSVFLTTTLIIFIGNIQEFLVIDLMYAFIFSMPLLAVYKLNKSQKKLKSASNLEIQEQK